MAFGDSNDIKINVTVDTADAIKAAKDISQAFKDISKTIGADFKTIASISKEATVKRLAEINAANEQELAKIKARTETKLAKIKQETEAFKQGEATKLAIAKSTNDAITKLANTISAITKQLETTKRQEAKETAKVESNLIKGVIDLNKEAANTKRADIKATTAAAINSVKEETKQFKASALERSALANVQSQNYRAQLKKDLDVFIEGEKTKRSQNQITLEQLRLEAAKVRQETAAIQSGGIGKGDAFGSVFNNLPNYAAGFYLVKEAIGAVTQTLSGLVRVAGGLAESANRVQSLQTAFSTLQQSVGRDPVASIERLREATQGLISDTELYQKANQAVLLGVPTKLFEESAAAAVKLGRAMGIDAALALESLSIGLGRQSRLYLDNLGIVVSATKAYENYSRVIGKSVEDFNDAEKRAAFFLETSIQLEENQKKLPPIVNDVGTAYKRVAVQTDNLKDSFLKAFNQSGELTSAFESIRLRLTDLIPAAINAGSAIATLVARLIEIGPPPIIQSLIDLAFWLGKTADQAIVLSEAAKRLRFEELKKEIQATEEQIKEYNEGWIIWGRAARESEQYLKRLQSELTALGIDLDIIDFKAQQLAERKIELRIDVEQIRKDISDTASTLSNFKRGVEESLGLIQIPGLDQTVVDAAIPKIDSFYKRVESGAISATQAGKEAESLFNDLANQVAKADIEKTRISLEKAKQAQASLTADKKKELEESNVIIKQLEEELKLKQESNALDERSRAQIAKLLQAREKLAKAGAQQGKKAADEASNELKKRQNEIEQFLLSVRRKTQTAISPKFEKQLAELFRTANPGSEEFEQRLKAIAEEAQQAKEDLKSLADAAKDFQDAIQAGVPKEQLPDTASGARQVKISLDEANEEVEKSKEEFARSMKQIGTQAASDLATGFAETIASGKGLGGPETAKQVTGAIGAVFGGAAGFAIGGPIGAQVGAGIGATLTSSIIKTAKKSNVYKAFEEIFDSGAISLVINRQIEDAAGNISIEPIAEAIRNPAGLSGGIAGIINQSILAYSPQGVFANLSNELRAQFEAVATSLGSVFGDSLQDIQVLTAVLAQNTGGSLQNLQVIIQATGKSFDEFAEAIYNAMLKGVISIKGAYDALVRLGGYFEKGIPGAVGAYKEAISNANALLKKENPGLALLDSLRDIGFEGLEAKKTFQEVIGEFGRSIGLTAEQLPLLFASLKYLGINTLEDLAKAGDNVLITFAEGVRRIREGITTTIEGVKIPIAPAPDKQRGPSGPSPAEKQKELLKQQVEEARNLLIASQKYANVLSTITKSKASQVAAGQAISKLESEILRKVKERDSTEKLLNKELDKGTRASAERIAQLSDKLAKAKQRLEELGATANDATRLYKDLDISAIRPLIQSQNDLGVVSRAIGVNLQTNIDILIRGFLQGRMSIAKVNEEINRTRDLLGPGIPGAIGAVTEAFNNLREAGTEGGQFSVDAFRDIFAEFRERFKNEGSALAEQQRQTLQANFDAARAALNAAVGPEETERARKVFEDAKKAYEDFKNSVQAPDLADLRAELLKTIDPEQVNAFFTALDRSGINTFSDFENASEEAIIGILNNLQQLGVISGETSDRIRGINQGLIDAETSANGGLDPLQEAINLVNQFNSGAKSLPPVFDATKSSIEKLNVPLGKLAKGFDNIIEKLGKLGGNTFENDVVFNIRTTGEQGAAALIDIVFGDGSRTSTGVGNGTSGTTTNSGSRGTGSGGSGSRRNRNRR